MDKEWNFKIIDGKYPDYESIHDDFVEDYIMNTELSNKEIRAKYGLGYSDFLEVSKRVREEYGLKRRPSSRWNSGRYYYKMKGHYKISRKIKGKEVYLGHVPTEELAIKMVKLCEENDWNIERCRALIKNWRVLYNLRHIKRNCCKCYDCIKVCPTGALSTDGESMQWEKIYCSQCNNCISICENEALFME